MTREQERFASASGRRQGSGSMKLTPTDVRNEIGVRSDERGQAMTEYLFILVVVALVLIPFARLVPEAIRGYVRPFYYCVSRPFP